MRQASKKEPFGYLMTIDLYNCREGVCGDIALGYKFLEEIVEKLGMKKQSPPFIFKSDEILYPEKAGLSGWIPLIESGVQFHTLTTKNFISVDIYSCGKFEPKNLDKFVENYFSPKNVEINFIERGLKYNE